jgi:NADH-quinone oxidoreductase subunit J
MVLFTFVVMLLNVGVEEKTHGSKIAKIIGFPAAVVILGVIATVILEAQKSFGRVALDDGITTTQDLSRVLFRDMLLPFELTSVLILIAILGAVALARKEGHS